ncbi:MAG: SurA N-terminal domain-containing protein [Spirochaetaceae bacterium]|jgi:parvulin-like peptidyl-prolyl isomerase|nr:SurA N-terminal domain-containing protein [Spirochaetaceae bacterium]
MSASNKTKHDEQSETARKFKQHPVTYVGTVIVLVVVVVAFVFWGANGWIFGERGVLSDDELTFATYDGIPVTLSPGSFFANQRKFLLEQQRQIRNDRYATEQAFKTAVIRTAVLKMMKDVKYRPPKSLVDRKVAELERYQENGKFSILRFRAESPSARLEIQKNIEEAFIAMRYYSDVATRIIQIDSGGEGGGSEYDYTVLTSSKEADFIGSLAAKQRSFKVAAFPFSIFPDNEVFLYASKNNELFKEAKLSQITLGPSKDNKEALKVLESINKGTTTFEDAAKAYSTDEFKDSGGETGSRMAYELKTLIPDEAERLSVINLEQGGVSAPVKVPSGWAIFRANAAAVSPNLNDKTVIDKVREYMNNSERGIIEDWLVNRAAIFAKDAENGHWDDAVLAHNVDSKNFGPLPLNYGDLTLFARLRDFSDASAVSGAADSENFWKTAFSTPVGTPCAPFVIDAARNEVVVLLPVEEIDDNEEAVKNTTNLYKTTFIETEILRAVDDTIMNSPKLVNNFENRYSEIFASSAGLSGGFEF